MISFMFAFFLGLVVAGLMTANYGAALMAFVVMIAFEVFLKIMEKRTAANKAAREEAPPDSVSALEFHNTESGRTHF